MEDGAGIFDLTFCIESSPAGLWVVLDYNIGLFETSTITRMLGHFERLLQGILADPSGSISTLPLLSEIERRQILVEWNDTAVDYPRDHCVHQLFEIQAEAQPEAEAIVFRDQRLTYRELNERANQWARHLQMLGLGPEVVAALYVERSLEMAVGLLAILKAGGAYLPLEPGYPRERLALMLEETHPSVLLTQERLNQGLPRTSAKIVCLDRDAPLTGLQQVDNPRSGATSENLAYVIFTSGSDGAPKGVLMPHQALVNHSLAVGRTYRLDPNDRVLQFASLSFDRGR